MKQNNTRPKLFQVFPAEGKLIKTEQYVARNFLAYNFLNSAYTIMYKDSYIFKVFVIEAATPEKANTMLTEYLNAVPKEVVIKLETDKYQIQDPRIGLISMQIISRYICGVSGNTNNTIRDQYLKEVINNLLR